MKPTFTPGPIYRLVQEKLTKALIPKFLEIEDESWKHAGHRAMKDDQWSGQKETHFKICVASDQFLGLSLIKRHQLIYSLLKEEMSNSIHALSLNAKTVEEYEKSLISK